MMTKIEGGVTAAKGFSAAGIHSGLRKNKERLDLALIVSECDCSTAGLYTANIVKAAPVRLSKARTDLGRARAIVCNSGNANACAPDDMENANRMAKAAAKALGIDGSLVLVASTGVIGQRLNVELIEKGMPELKAALSSGASASEQAAFAIMTTDTCKKEIAFEFIAGGKTCRIGGIAKGSGMIHPNLGTMLCFVTTDCAISAEQMKKALVEAAAVSFNMVSVDGDTSTNDTLVILANGLAGNDEISTDGADYAAFKEALFALTEYLAREMAKDGEGATKLLECRVTGAESDEAASVLARSVIHSPLVKAAAFGCDANWGRIICAMGYSGANFDPDAVDIGFASDAGNVAVAIAGHGIAVDEALATEILKAKEVVINISTGKGSGSAVAWGCDLSYDYVKINGDYRT